MSAERTDPSNRKGNRSIDNLSATQRARKRANDRVAKRNSRARAKEHLRHLESELRRLHRVEQVAWSLQQQNAALDRELQLLKRTTGSSYADRPVRTWHSEDLPDAPHGLHSLGVLYEDIGPNGHMAVPRSLTQQSMIRDANTTFQVRDSSYNGLGHDATSASTYGSVSPRTLPSTANRLDEAEELKKRLAVTHIMSNYGHMSSMISPQPATSVPFHTASSSRCLTPTAGYYSDSSSAPHTAEAAQGFLGSHLPQFPG
ncbi:hypothetical protein QQS21_007549 [Conoideocrella luteorostrata]|uniref:BZIP domain-containing protein n=1 Tax=Conoideocrella luteorostrata TaxID=1105319 RepID=A0AAJ0CKJ0_9HYPO|nr:hypothetical protein QQS21_007549 [Conoideocrella luteorostrata]